MEKDNNKRTKKSTRNSPFDLNKIVLVQFMVCAFIVCLIAIVCRLGIADDFIKKYKNIMGENISVSQMIDSAKDVAQSVMKPTGESNTVEIIGDKEAATPKADEPAETVEAPESGERTTAQVMASFSDSESITIPVHGEITSRFGYRTDPISGEYKLHSAIDISANEGTKVSAAWDGIVTKSGYDVDAGYYVWMVHKNGCETLYCHLSEILVDTGNVIRAGEILALSGNTGYSTGPHLHFGIKKDGEMIDPLKYITPEGGRV